MQQENTQSTIDPRVFQSQDHQMELQLLPMTYTVAAFPIDKWPKSLFTTIDEEAKRTAAITCKWLQLNTQLETLKDSLTTGLPPKYLRYKLKIYNSISDPIEQATYLRYILNKEITNTIQMMNDKQSHLTNHQRITNDKIKPILEQSGMKILENEFNDYLNKKIVEFKTSFLLKQSKDRLAKEAKQARFKETQDLLSEPAQISKKDLNAMTKKMKTLELSFKKLATKPKPKQKETTKPLNGQGKKTKSQPPSQPKSTGTKKRKDGNKQSTSKGKKSRGPNGKSTAPSN